MPHENAPCHITSRGTPWYMAGGPLTCLHQVGKGRDVGLGQITGFVAKISMGNGMQSRSREV